MEITRIKLINNIHIQNISKINYHKTNLNYLELKPATVTKNLV